MQRKTSAGLWSSKGSRSTAKNGLIYGLRAKVEVRPTLAVGLAWGCPNPKRPGRGSSFIHHHVFVDLFFFFFVVPPSGFYFCLFFFFKFVGSVRVGSTGWMGFHLAFFCRVFREFQCFLFRVSFDSFHSVGLNFRQV